MTTGATTTRRPLLATLPRFSKQVNRVAHMGRGWACSRCGSSGNFVSAPGQFVSVLLLGITLGAIYALVALGYTLVYGIIELINFAHGDVFMLGTMVTITVANGWLGLNGTQAWYVTIPLVVVALAAAMAFCGDAQRHHRAHRLPAAAQRAQAGAADHRHRHVVPAPEHRSGHLGLQRAAADGIRREHLPRASRSSASAASPTARTSLIVVLITIPVLLALVYLVRSTKQGKAMRAVGAGHGREPDDGHRRRPHHRVHVRARRRAGRRGRAPVRDVPDLDAV